MLKYCVKIFLPLLLICACVAGVVSGVHLLTEGKIAENERAVEAAKEERKSALVSEIFGDGVVFESVAAPEGTDDVKLAPTGECCVTLTVYGYNKTEGIQLFAAFGADGAVKRVVVLSSAETTGIGTKVGDDGYLSQYVGVSGVVSFGNGVDKIAGATLSSKAVLSGVNAARDAMIAVKGGN